MKSILICPLSELEDAQDPIRALATPPPACGALTCVAILLFLRPCHIQRLGRIGKLDFFLCEAFVDQP